VDIIDPCHAGWIAGLGVWATYDAFLAGFGQRFDRRRQSPFDVEVTARTGSGSELRFVWGKGRRR
jgi:hypothetical protein